MKIYEYGSRDRKTLILIHGFQCPVEIWDDYVARYEKNYHVLVPCLPGHNPDCPEEFVSFEKNAEEIENFCLSLGKQQIFAVYGISMGGLQTAILWQRNRLHFEKIILESAPLLPFPRIVAWYLTRTYLQLTHKTQQRDEKTLKGAMSMMGEKNGPHFIRVLDHMTDNSLKTCLSQVFPYGLTGNCSMENTGLWYFYGGTAAELPFRKVARYLKKAYPAGTTWCFAGKGHCEDVLKHPENRFSLLDAIFGGEPI